MAALLIPATITAMLAGITEPLEFTFLFVAPVLWFVHSILAATLDATLYFFGVVGDLSGGIIDMAGKNWIPLFQNHWTTYALQIIIGTIFAFIYFYVFKYMILKFNYATPGRDDVEEVTLKSKKDYLANKKGESTAANPYEERATAYLEGLGGKDNIETVTNCATRLRVTVKDLSLVKSDSFFKQNKAAGVVHHGEALQVIVGLDVPQVRDKFEELMGH